MNIRTLIATVVAVTAVLASTGASAGVLAFTDNLTVGPTFDRPRSLTDLSLVGTEVYYDTNTFTVDIAGNYSILSSSLFDSVLILYQGSFSPSAQFTNIIAFNDDFVMGNTLSGSGFTIALTTGVSYQLVESSFANRVTGPYAVNITGPGTAMLAVTSAVPEPESLALFGIALAALAATARRRKL